MVEWSITAVLKTAVPRGTGGSNPSLSAFFVLVGWGGACRDFFYAYCPSEIMRFDDILLIYDKSDADTVDVGTVLQLVEELGIDFRV